MDCKHLIDKTAGKCYFCGVPVGWADPQSQPHKSQYLSGARAQIEQLLHDNSFSLMEIAEAIVRFDMSHNSGKHTSQQETELDVLLKQFSKLRILDYKSQ